MLILALLFDAGNIVIGILDFFVVGLVIGPVWNFIAAWTVGAWLAMQTIKELNFQEVKGVRTRIKRVGSKRRLLLKLSKRVLVPFIGNSIPIAKFFPFWLWQVWGALDKNPFAQPEEMPEEPQVQAGQAAAAGAQG